MDIEEDTIDNGEDQMQAALSAAWDAAEGESSAEDDEIHQPAVQSDEPAGVDAAGESSVDADPDPEGVDRVEKPESGAEAGADTSLTDLDVAPKSLSPEAREVWKDAPEAVRREFARLDSRMEGMATKYAHNAQRAEAMDKALAPFQQFMSVNGGPSQAIPALLQTGALLQMGTSAQKAQIVANIINQYGVDVATLDGMLVGEVNPEDKRRSELDSLLEQRLAPMQQQLQGYQQREQQMRQQSQQKVHSDVTAFASSNEFYHDVASDMADLLDMAANRGRPMSMQDAYDIACKSHPTISKIVEARRSQEAVAGKRAAAVSVTGSPGNSGGQAAGGSIRDYLEQNWDSAGRM